MVVESSSCRRRMVVATSPALIVAGRPCFICAGRPRGERQAPMFHTREDRVHRSRLPKQAGGAQSITEQQGAPERRQGAGQAIFMVQVAPPKPQRQVRGDFVVANAPKRNNNRYQPLAMSGVAVWSGVAEKVAHPTSCFVLHVCIC